MYEERLKKLHMFSLVKRDVPPSPLAPTPIPITLKLASEVASRGVGYIIWSFPFRCPLSDSQLFVLLFHPTTP